MPQFSSSLDTTFQALADPTRRSVVERLSRGPSSVGDLARGFEMALPSFLQHVQVLEARGLIHTHKAGRVRICEIVPEPLEEMAGWLSEQRRLWTARLDQLDAFLLSLPATADPERT